MGDRGVYHGKLSEDNRSLFPPQSGWNIIDLHDVMVFNEWVTNV